MLNIDVDSKYDSLLKVLKTARSSSLNKFSGIEGINRTKILLEKLGNPQENLNVIHVAGTSGKGSTCFILSSLLRSSGFKVGLNLSPHLFDLRERIQINNQLIPKEKFVEYFEFVNSKVEETAKATGSDITFFEIISALTFYIFQKEKVDYVVLETGLGGLFDVTNVISNNKKISLITRIGLDHTHILGNTLSEIANQKIGIANKDSVVFTTEQNNKVLKVFKDICKKRNAKLSIIRDINSKGVSGRYISHNKVIVLNNEKLSLIGRHQIENCKLALRCFSYISTRDKFEISKSQITDCLSNLEFEGRFSVKEYKNKKIIFDVAHNPQKIRSLISTLKEEFPKQKFNFLLGFKFNNDFVNIIKLISPLSKNITITNINEKGLKESENDIKSTVKALKNIHFTKYNILPNPNKAIQELIDKNEKEAIVVTGSFFLISKMRKYFNK